MIRYRISQVFSVVLILTILATLIVGVAWLFDSYPANLLAVSLLFQILFGAEIKFK
jgi:hypothetical protein